jgi:hypothetical protein
MDDRDWPIGARMIISSTFQQQQVENEGERVGGVLRRRAATTHARTL